LDHKREIDRRIARERIEILLKLAKEEFHKDRTLAKRYVTIAKKIAMKCNVRIPAEYKRFICRECGDLLVPGVNCRVRTRSKGGTRVVITCLTCGAQRGYPAAREKEVKRKR